MNRRNLQAAGLLALLSWTLLGGGAIAAPEDVSRREAEKLRGELKRAARRNKPLAITPGVGVGPIRFGMSAAEVKQAVGKPYRVTGNAYEYQHLGLAVLLDREERVGVIMVGAWCESHDILLDVFKGATKEGVKLKSTREEIVAAFGPPDSTTTIGEKSLEFEALKYGALRTQFALRKGKLVHITLRAPATQVK